MKTTISLLLLCVAFSLSAQTTIQWRGENRTGVYNEKGLLKSWPEKGPQLLWHYDGLGEGHSSVAVDGGKVYITGMTGETGYLYVFDTNGKLLNKKEYGKEWSKNYNGARGTVSISEGKLYIFSGAGLLVCMDQNTLNILWKKDIEADFDGKNITWGVNESPLVVGDKVILTPGGKKNNVVALNKNTGALVWSCEGEGDVSSYCSPVYVGNTQVPQVVTMLASHILGIDVATGKKLWSFKYENDRKIHPNTPVYDGKDMVLCTGGYDKGTVMLRLVNGGRSVEKVWEQADARSKLGGVVKLGNYAYMGGDDRSNRQWSCVDWATGELKYKDNVIATGAVIADADGMLYCYSDKGEMALVKATPEKFDLVSKFNITLGTDQHWAHPVIYQSILFVRHGNTLMAYKVKA